MSRYLYKSYLVIFLFCSFVSSDEYSVMTLNVENLFDTKDDLKKNDKAFLPIEQKQSKKHKESCLKIRVSSWKNECLYLDWNIETKDAKLKNLVDYILLFENGADIIALQEVENNNILNQLYKLLEPYGYIDFVLLEGKDYRGIDNAIISKFKIHDSKLHYIKFSGDNSNKDSRPILDVTINVNNKKIAPIVLSLSLLSKITTGIIYLFLFACIQIFKKKEKYQNWCCESWKRCRWWRLVRK